MGLHARLTRRHGYALAAMIAVALAWTSGDPVLYLGIAVRLVMVAVVVGAFRHRRS